MTLGQFAVAVGAPGRWVLNALAVLDLRPPYSVELARRLALARVMKQAVGVPLRRAYGLAGRALAGTDAAGRWRHESPDGGVALEVDLARFHSNFAAHLALARSHYAERRRGRPPKRRKSAIARAKEYGIDVTLLDSALRRTPSERLKLLDENMEFVRKIRGIAAR